MLRPMLACSDPPDLTTLPLDLYYASIKMDGIRALIMPDGPRTTPLLSRRGKPIPQPNLQLKMAPLKEWARTTQKVLDGELWSPGLSFNEIQSIVMAKEEKDCTKIQFYAFDLLGENDWLAPTATFEYRTDQLRQSIAYLSVRESPPIVYVNQQDLTVSPKTPEDYLTDLFNKQIDHGGEGLILKHKHHPYKHGRTTPRSGTMYKLKEFLTDEAQILDTLPLSQMNADAPREKDVFGHPKRVNKRFYRHNAPLLGALLVRNRMGVEFQIGSGFIDAERTLLWEQRTALPGQWVEYRYMPHGSKDRPRMPTFLRFRQDLDTPKAKGTKEKTCSA